VLPACAASALPGAQDDDVWPELHPRPQARYQAVSPALARLLCDDILTTYGSDLPSAVACLTDNFEACVAHLKQSTNRLSPCGRS